MASKGRPRKSGARDKRNRLIVDRVVQPADHILERREAFAFVTPTKGPEGRVGTIDQDICDGIGQLHALGYLDGHGHDPQDLRDAGRAWRDHYVMLMRPNGFKTGGYERTDKGRAIVHFTGKDAKFDLVDDTIDGVERRALMDLLVDPVIGSWPLGEENSPWVRALIAEGLLKKGKVVKFCRFPDANDKALLAAALRGLFLLMEAAVPSRHEQMRRVA